MLTVIVILWELWDQNVTLLISFAFLTFTKVIVKYWSNQNTKEASADMSNHLNERMVKNLTNCRNQMSFDIIILSSFFFKNCLLLLVLPCVPLPEFYLQAPVPITNAGRQNWYGISMFHHIWLYISLKIRSPRRIWNNITMTNVLIFHDLVLWLVSRVVIVVMLLMQ